MAQVFSIRDLTPFSPQARNLFWSKKKSAISVPGDVNQHYMESSREPCMGMLATGEGRAEQ